MAIRYLSGINVDSNTLFVDSTNNRVGIGTGSPSAALDVTGGSIQLSTSGSGLYFGPSSAAQIIGVSGASSYLAFGTVGTEKVRITAGGNVGIGTTSPSEKLEVNGNVQIGTSVDAKLYMVSSGGNGYNERFFIEGYADGGTYGGGFKLSTRNDSNIFNTAVTVNRNGNVLIGTTTDAGYKLRVNGTGRYDGNLQFWADVAGASPRLIFGGETSSTDKSIFLETYYMVFQGHNNEGFKFQTTSAAGVVTNRMSILGTGTIVLSNYGSGSKTGTATYGLAVDSSGNIIEVTSTLDGSGTTNYVTKWQDANTLTDSQIFDNGTNVGIGTASPNAKLEVSKADNAQIVVRQSDAPGSSKYAQIVLTHGTSYFGANDKSYQLVSNALGTGEADFAIQYWNGSTYNERLRVTSAGNVGIGTTSPAYTLDVNGSMHSTNITIADAIYHEGDTNNYISFGTDIQAFTTSGAERMRITSAGNVGIGTTSPAYKVDVLVPNSSGDTKQNVQQWGQLNQNTLQLNMYGGSTDLVQFAATNAEQNISIVTEASGSLTAATSKGIYIKSGGNVGIGNTNPTAKLQVGPEAHPSATGIEVAAGAGGANLLALDSSTNHNWLPFTDGSNYYSAVSHTFRNELHSTDWMKITSAGNVGIGTTSPVGRLHLTGDYNGAQNTLNLENNWPNTHPTSLINFWAYYNTSNPQAVIEAGQDVSATNAGVISFKTMTSGAAPSTKMIIKPDGNVGIGTTSPGSKLDVYLSEGSYIRATNASSGIGAGNHWGFGLYEGTSLSAAFRIVRDGTGDQVSIGTANNQSFAFWQNNTERMRIAVGGNVGIGTASPAAKLHLSGSGATELRITSTTANTNSLLSFYENTLASWGIDAGQANGSFFITDLYNSATRVTITATGRVGIGTTSPQVELHVKGNNGWGEVRVEGQTFASGHGASLEFYSEGTALADIYASTDKHLYFRTNGTTERMRILANGNVGIGTTSPDRRLHVVSSDDTRGIMVEQTLASSYAEVHFKANREYRIGTGGSTSAAEAANNWYVYDATAAAQRFVITAAGNVGIGTTSPSKRLHVASGGNEGIFMEGTANGGHWFDFKSANSNLWSMGAQPGLMGWYNRTDSTYKMVIADGGAVGIGTTAPSSILHVSSTGANAYSSTITKGSNMKGIVNTLSNNADDMVGIYFGTGTDAGGSHWSGITGSRSNSAVDWSTQLNFYTHDENFSNINDATQKMVIKGSGNVGIGTTSPGAKLDVSGDIRFGTGGAAAWGNGLLTLNSGWGTGLYPTVGSYGGNSGSLIMLHNPHVPFRTDNAASVSYTGRAGLRMAIDTAGTGWWDAGLAGDFYHIFKSTGGEFLRITNTGNVGIGTTAPGGRLHIATPDPATNFIAIDFRNPTYGIYGKSNSISGRGNTLEFTATDYNTSGSVVTREVLTLRPEGNVGIGTTAPTAKLEVTGGSDGDAMISMGSNSVSGILNAPANMYINADSDNNAAGGIIAFGFNRTGYSGGAEAMRLLENGNVGIGTTTPKTKLDVNGTIGFGSKSITLTDTFAAALTVNMNDHTGCYVKITAFGDWGNHSTIAYLGEFFIQASAGAYNEPGIIIRQVDNTGGGDDIQAQILDPAGAGTRDFIIELKATSASNTPFTAYIQYEVRGMYNSVS